MQSATRPEPLLGFLEDIFAPVSQTGYMYKQIFREVL